MAEGEAGGAEDIVPQTREALRGQRDVSALSQRQLAAAGKTVITASVTSTSVSLSGLGPGRGSRASQRLLAGGEAAR